MVASSILNDHSLIVFGDLNLNLSMDEVSSASKVIEPMASCFIDIFELVGLKGVGPSGIVPTWSNGRNSKEGVAKRLDHFLMEDSLDKNKLCSITSTLVFNELDT